MPEKGSQKGPCRAPRGPLGTPWGPLRGPSWGPPEVPLGPPKLGGPVTLLRVLPPVTGPVCSEDFEKVNVLLVDRPTNIVE